MVEFARVAWRRSRHEVGELDALQREANRFLAMLPSVYFPNCHAIAKAIAHVSLAVCYWRSPATHSKAQRHLADAGRLYQKYWPVGTSESVAYETIPLDDDNEFNPFLVPHSLETLLSDTFDPASPHAKGYQPNGTTWMILYELLTYVMGHARNGFKLPMKGLFVGRDSIDREHEVGSVLNVVARRLEAPIFAFYPDPISLGVTHIGPSMRHSMRAAWRCCLFDAPETEAFSIRVDIHVDQPQVPSLDGGSAGGLVAAMMCAARDGIEFPPNVSATCSLALSPEERRCREAVPLDPNSIRLAPIGGVVAKLTAAWKDTGVEEVFVHSINWKEWDKARRPGASAREASTLSELIDRMDRDRPRWEALERLARLGSGRWDRIITSQNNQRVDRDHHHHLELYVEPHLKVEGPPRFDRQAPREPETSEPQEMAVPGAPLSDEAILNALALAFGGSPEVDEALWNQGPTWLRPGRDLLVYDQAGAGKSVLTLRMAHLVNQTEHWQSVFGTQRPTLVVRIEGEWDVIGGSHVDLREMLYRHALRQLEQPVDNVGTVLRDDERQKLRSAIEFALNRRRVVLIVDGFDQLSAAARDHIVKVHDTADGHLCRWIIASRQHTIATLFGSSRRVDDWMRIRIEPFDEAERDRYLELAGLADVWKDYVNPESMGDLLQLPWVLDQVRRFIENRVEAARESGRDSEPVEFESVSQLALVTSRLSLDRALDPKKLADDLAPPEHLKTLRHEQLTALEHVLSLVAFEMLLLPSQENDETWNGRVRGHERKQAFLEKCEDRFVRPLDLEILQIRTKPVPDLGDDRKLDRLRTKSSQAVETWHWALKVLDAIELHHRTYVEQNDQDILAFRDRKAMEFYASRYLTRFATPWDIAADYPEDKQTTTPEDQPCAWQHIADEQWFNTWKLAIKMPQEPLPGTTETVFTGAVLDPLATCHSLSALFRPTLDGERRPTELIWRCWPLFEYDELRMHDCRFRQDSRLVTGHDLVGRGQSDWMTQMAKSSLLGERSQNTAVIEQRKQVLESFRDEKSRQLATEFAQRFDTVLQADGSRVPMPADASTRSRVLSQWQTQSSLEKSLTMIQCPPKSWIDECDFDPRVNEAIEEHETEALWPIRIQATAVTRGMFRLFDDAITMDTSVAEKFMQTDHADFPVVEVNWYDTWVFCKWIGSQYRLPTESEWEHACRAGTKTEFHFGSGLNGTLANCDGTRPYGTDANGSKLKAGDYLGGCTPAGLERYPCNAYGLFDVHGNVWEWCENWEDESAQWRVLRGGSWFNYGRSCRSGNRLASVP
jgi:hypothetical protein